MTQMQYDLALKQLKTQIKQNPNVVQTVLAKGKQQFETGNYGEAAEWYNMAAEIDPANIQAANSRLDAIEKWLNS
jgi:cytochrome c-type biogenesis protein CcmH/NrfG